MQYNKAVVGRNAFAHEAGIHQHGVLADRETYEVIDASQVGQEAAQIVLGKHSGRHAFADTLEKMGIHVQGDALNAAFVRFKELADKKVEITEADLEAIVAEELGTGMVHRYSVYELEVHGGTATPPTARVVLGHGDGKVEATGSGDGMIDAAIAAISEATGVRGKVGNFQVSSVTGGSDALGAVAITVDSEGRKVTGRGVATDVVEASARAYLNAVNKLVRLRERGEVARDHRAVRDAVDDRTTTSTCGATASTRSRTCAKRDSIPHRPEALRDRCSRYCPNGSSACSTSAPATASRSASCSRPGPGATGVGLDFQAEMLDRARERFAGEPAWRSSATISTSRSPPTSATSTSVVSSFAIHHLVPDRQPPSTARSSRTCGPVDCSPTPSTLPRPPRRHEEFLARARDEPSRTTTRRTSWSRSPTHLAWLDELGFADAECLWKWRELAVVTGNKPWCDGNRGGPAMSMLEFYDYLVSSEATHDLALSSSTSGPTASSRPRAA